MIVGIIVAKNPDDVTLIVLECVARREISQKVMDVKHGLEVFQDTNVLANQV